MAEVTQNHPADASASVWAQQNPAPFSPATSHSPGPEQSRESFRTRDPGGGVRTPQDSSSLLLASPDHLCASVLASPPIQVDLGPLAAAPSGRDAPAATIARPGDPVLTPEERSSLWAAGSVPEDSDPETGILEQSQITLVSLTDSSLQEPEDTPPDAAAAPPGEQRLQMVPEQRQRVICDSGDSTGLFSPRSQEPRWRRSLLAARRSGTPFGSRAGSGW